MKNNMVLDTLFYPFEAGVLPWPAEEGRVLFLNAQAHKALSHFPSANFTAQQFFYPYADALKARGFDVQPVLPQEAQQFDFVLLAAPKNQVETMHLIAGGLRALKPGGLFLVAADNKAGGARLAKNLGHFGLEDIRSDTRNKCRVCWAIKQAVDEDAIDAALRGGAPQPIADGAFQSWPGIYGWQKIDAGSALLLQHLPADLKGRGADFGCGYGFLSDHVLQYYEVRSLICADADWRALAMCRVNLERFESKAEIHFEWSDLTQNPGFSNLDFIVMNPPFHEGTAADISIGKRFIVNAHQSLKRGGTLWMVANKQLPYESVLEETFFKIEKIFEGQGFKIFCATK
ncbi:MAG: class I SAM-dependent methyltransferase [Alphaproteobacteria bacterium]